MTLHEIQKKVRAKKDERNNFGGYSYRNAEKILGELKSVLPDGWAVYGSDRLEVKGEFLFLVHSVAIYDGDGNQVGPLAEGWAMHPTQKKGMDPAQITGSCSTYAKKYALQNLLAIDDGSIDPDATNKGDNEGISVKGGQSWEQSIISELPPGATGMDKANAVADAIIANYARKSTAKQLENEWDRRADIVERIKKPFPEVASRIIDAYENRVIELNEPDAAELMGA